MSVIHIVVVVYWCIGPIINPVYFIWYKVKKKKDYKISQIKLNFAHYRQAYHKGNFK